MPDLESRLLADAKQRAPVEPPSLDETLDAVHTLDRRATHVRPLALVAAAAVVLLVAGLAAVLANGPSHSNPRPAGPSTVTSHPHKIKKPAPLPGVLRPIADYGTAGVVAVPGEPTAYDVIVPFEPDSHPDKCGFYDPKVTVEEQSETTVRLRVSGKVYQQKLKNGGYRSFGCSGNQWRRLRIQLNAPIGTRVLYDSGKARDTVADPNDYPDFGWVPSGYHQVSGHRPGSQVTTSNGQREYTTSYSECSQGSRNGRPLPKKPCTALLYINIGPGNPLSWLGKHRTKVSINGYPATLSQPVAHQPKHACVTWQEAPSSHGRQVCIYADTPVDIPDLLRAARSVH